MDYDESDAEDKLRVAAERVYDSSELPQLVPANLRAEAVEEIIKGMKQPLERTQDLRAGLRA
jgi:uncharacterized protein YeeX (DUF496 family)